MERDANDLYIAGVGVYLPERERAEDAVRRGDYNVETAAVDEIESACVESELFPGEMAVLAGRDALRMAGIPQSDVRAVFHSYLDYQGAQYWDTAPYVALHTVGGAVPAFDVRQSCNEVISCVLNVEGC